jgi:flagellar biosynthesis/type III secretory pathway chaperone
MLEEALAELETLLVQERDAIRRLDGRGVTELADRKQSIVSRLNAARSEFGAAEASRLRAITPMLRQNGVLLAHARDILRDALAAMRQSVPRTSYDPSRLVHGLPRMLSVRG